jgi:hypothetical protein
MSSIKHAPKVVCLMINCTNSQNIGKVVTLVKYEGVVKKILPNGTVRYLPSWEVDSSVSNWAGIATNSVPEYQLKPISGPLINFAESEDVGKMVLNEVAA